MLPAAKKTDTEKKNSDQSAFYYALSARFKIAKYVVTVILVLFLLTMVAVFRNEITVENLRYLAKDIELGENIAYVSKNVIYYDADKQINLKLFKGDICIAGSTSFVLCDMQGNRLLSETSLFSNPVVLTGDKYLLVYGLSENTYAVYNTFSKLHTETFEHPITGAALASDGHYAIVTKASDYLSVIYIYNQNFEQIGKISKDKYVMNVKFNSDSSELLIVSTYPDDGEYCAEVMAIAPLSDNASYSGELRNVIPLVSGYYSDGGYCVFCDKKAFFFDSELFLRNTYDYAGRSPSFAAVFEKNAVLSYRQNIVGNESGVLLFDVSGNVRHELTVDGSVKKACCGEKYIYLLLDEKVCRIDPVSGDLDYVTVDDNPIEILLGKNETVLVCYSNRTIKISFVDEDNES